MTSTTAPPYRRSAATTEREENTTFPRVLVSNETATLIITGRAPSQLPLRAPGTNEKHPLAAATSAAYPRCFMPIAVRQDMTLPLLIRGQFGCSPAGVRLDDPAAAYSLLMAPTRTY